MKRSISFLLAVALLSGCRKESPSVADSIYHGGTILTMAGTEPAYVEALAVKDGKIVFSGAAAEALAMKGTGTKVTDLGGKHLMPGFIDSHSHFINALSLAGQANCYAAPFGPGSTKEGIIEALQQLVADKKIPKGELVMGYGYDDSVFPEGGKLTAADLDPAFPDNPVMVGHVSLHGAVLNSAALAKYGVTAETPTPPGGIIVRKPGSNEPEGLLMETAYLPIFATLPKPSPNEQMDALVAGQKIYAAAGVTTAHEGATHIPDLQILQRGAKEGKLFIDIVAFPFITEFEFVLRTNPPETFGRYENGLKLGGIKVTCDGSPQGKTAFFTTPYLTGGPAGQENWTGEPTFPPEAIHKMVKSVYDSGLPLIVHGNGDAAIDLILAAHEAALGDRKSGDHRTVIVHCQFVREDQLDKIKELNLLPSFYTEHTYFFGSTHVKQRGEAQASFLSPLKSALDRGIRISNHTDFNVAPIDQLFVVWSAVNRVSREGVVIGPDERVSAYEALRAVTVNPAYAYREESVKGTLEVGKLADLVILDRDPLSVAPIEIKDIKVLETIKEGATVYAAE